MFGFESFWGHLLLTPLIFFGSKISLKVGLPALKLMMMRTNHLSARLSSSVMARKGRDGLLVHHQLTTTDVSSIANRSAVASLFPRALLSSSTSPPPPSKTTVTPPTNVHNNALPAGMTPTRREAQEYHGHNFPDFIDAWDRKLFHNVGYGLGATTSLFTLAPLLSGASLELAAFTPAALLGGLTALYWKVGLHDIAQKGHAVRRNYPVLGNLRYVLETIRPEIRQYLIESDNDGKPLDRMHRSLVYRRSKAVDDTLPFGTRRDVYAPRHEWACHSMFPKPPIKLDNDDANYSGRVVIGTSEFGTKRPYSASILNISAMSYGAISDNAILALSAGAKMGNFYHNTGEGGVSKSHKLGGGDLVWNVGTGYFGCGVTNSDGVRVFDEDLFLETLRENPTVRMIEVKLSQGAKPGHGGILPKSKITPEIANARKLQYPAEHDCHSPATHSAFDDHVGLLTFVNRVRTLSGGLPVGFKMCVGDPRDVACIVRAMVDLNTGPDFITIDGGEGGTGAAPPEYSDSVGLPLEEGLVVVRNLLVGAGLRSKVKLIASGRVTNGFSLVRTLALGADATNAARAFMLSLGCIQALKCNTNKCPTGIATQDRELQYGLDPEEKSYRVYNYHSKTLTAAAEIVGTIGHDRFVDLSGNDIMRRLAQGDVKTLEDYLPNVETESLLKGNAPLPLQEIWNGTAMGAKPSAIRWIY